MGFRVLTTKRFPSGRGSFWAPGLRSSFRPKMPGIERRRRTVKEYVSTES